MNANKELTRTQRLLRTIEPVIYAKRWLTMTILVAATVLLAWQMVQIKTDAGFDKSIPIEHPYMKVLKQYMADFGGANPVLVALMAEQGHGEHYKLGRASGREKVV